MEASADDVGNKLRSGIASPECFKHDTKRYSTSSGFFKLISLILVRTFFLIFFVTFDLWND